MHLNEWFKEKETNLSKNTLDHLRELDEISLRLRIIEIVTKSNPEFVGDPRFNRAFNQLYNIVTRKREEEKNVTVPETIKE